MIKVVAENINIMSKYTGNAMRERDPKPIQEWAEKLTERGADVLDLNLGPARKGGPEMMQWLVKTVQEVTSLPLFLDTTNSEAIDAGLQVYVPKSGAAIINSIMATPRADGPADAARFQVRMRDGRPDVGSGGHSP